MRPVIPFLTRRPYVIVLLAVLLAVLVLLVSPDPRPRFFYDAIDIFAF